MAKAQQTRKEPERSKKAAAEESFELVSFPVCDLRSPCFVALLLPSLHKYGLLQVSITDKDSLRNFDSIDKENIHVVVSL